MVNSENGKFIFCEKCGKKLIERLPNGIFHFKFGKKATSNKVPVDLYVYGSLKMKCIKSTCGHWNIIHFFPPQFTANADVALQSTDQSEEEILRENENEE